MDQIVQPYQFEPLARDHQERTERVAAVYRAAHADLLHEDPALLVGRSATGARTWCTCGDCERMSTDEENLCCHEIAVTNGLRQDLYCITEMEEFQYLVLYRPALNLLRHNKAKYVKDRSKVKKLKKEPVANDVWRYLAYSNYVSWINAGRLLGKGTRVVLPSCVASKI